MKIKAPTFLFSIFLLSPAIAHGQSYSMDWFALSSGGGVSASSSYQVNTTLGNSIAGSSQGGPYSLSGGLPDSSNSQPASNAPELIIVLDAGDVAVSWLQPATGWILERTSELGAASPSWTEVSAPYQTNTTHVFVTLSAPAEKAYFRLRKLSP